MKAGFQSQVADEFWNLFCMHSLLFYDMGTSCVWLDLQDFVNEVFKSKHKVAGFLYFMIMPSFSILYTPWLQWKVLHHSDFEILDETKNIKQTISDQPRSEFTLYVAVGGFRVSCYSQRTRRYAANRNIFPKL